MNSKRSIFIFCVILFNLFFFTLVVNTHNHHITLQENHNCPAYLASFAVQENGLVGILPFTIGQDPEFEPANIYDPIFYSQHIYSPTTQRAPPISF